MERAATRFTLVIIFLLCFLVARFGKLFGLSPSLADLIFLVSATAATVFVLHQRLPFQNIFGLFVIITIFTGLVFLVGAIFQISFQPALFHSEELSPFAILLLWIIALINARGTASLLLFQIRCRSSYGLWLIGLSSLILTVLTPGARTSAKFFCQQFCVALIVFVATVPWFIDKKRVEHPPDIQSLFIMTLLLLW